MLYAVVWTLADFVTLTLEVVDQLSHFCRNFVQFI